MPFTFSHPAIVLPATFLPRRSYSLTGLVIGSVTPDFEYFIRMKDLSIYGHSIAGIFWFDLPLGFLLAFIYHGIVRDAFIANLPLAFKSRLMPYCRFNWTAYVRKNWPVVIVSLVVGAASHLFWDGFTHSNGFFVAYLPVLRHHVQLFGFWLPLYNIGQHLSTLVGGIVILAYIFHLPKDTSVSPAPGINYWFLIFAISTAIVAVKVVTGMNYRSFDQTIVTVIASGLMAIIVTSWFFRTRLARIGKSGQ